MRALWLTDVHLNFLEATAVDEFLQHLGNQQPDAVLISGDIGESQNIVDYLRRLHAQLACPIYFVLGNHDFYFGSIREVRRAVEDFCESQEELTYLTAAWAESLTSHVGLVGHDGWADARIGDYERSLVMMNDYRLIHELAPYSKQDRLAELHALGDEAGKHIRQVLPMALDRFAEVIVLTHVPPLREACWYDGRVSDDEWSPHFTCKAVGDALLEIAPDYPDHSITVLCGHTHSRGECHPLPNLRILTGAAEYEKPAIEQVFQFQ